MSAALAQIGGAFVHPAMLSGLGLVAAPIIIHWLSRRRFTRVPWAATRFLLEAHKENRRRTRFEQWLLVALRCAAMALLALLIARPFVRPGFLGSMLGSASNAQRIIVLDDSASLSYRAGAATEFDILRAAAERLLSWLHQEAAGEPVTLFVTSRPDAPLVRDARISDADLYELRAKLRKLEPVATPAHPANVFAKLADGLLHDKARPAQLYVLTDLQRTDWAPSGGPDVFAPLRRAAENRPTNAPLRLVLVGARTAARPNVAITELRLDRPQAIAGVPCLVRATTANFSARPADAFSLQVTIDGVPQPAVQAEPIAADAQRGVTFEITLPDPGFHELRVSTEALDPFAMDDARSLAVPVKEALAVLIVDGQPAANQSEDEVYFLRNALAPGGQFSSGLRTDTIDPDQLEATDLSAYDVVLLCNVAPPGPGALDGLQRFVARGGGLALFLGSEVGSAEDYNRSLFNDGAGLLPAALAPPAEAPGTGAALIRSAEHPVTAMFPVGSETLSEYVHFRRYYRITEPPATDAAASPATQPAGRTGAQVLARFNDAEHNAALIERPFGRGRVMLFTSTIDAEWNDWARSVDGSYVVTLLELVQYLARRPEHPGSITVGRESEFALSPDDYELTATLKPPTADSSPVTLTPREADVLPGQPVIMPLPILSRLGTYQLELTTRKGENEQRPLCVNFDPAESDLRPASSADLAPALRGVPFEMVESADEFLQGEEQTRRELWPALLAALAIVLMSEQALAWWFGAPTAMGRRKRAGG